MSGSRRRVVVGARGLRGQPAAITMQLVAGRAVSLLAVPAPVLLAERELVRMLSELGGMYVAMTVAV